MTQPENAPAGLTTEQLAALQQIIVSLQHGQQAYLALGRFLRIQERKGLLDKGDVLEVLAEMQQSHDDLNRALQTLLGVLGSPRPAPN